MTGLECLKKELLNRGCTKLQVEAKILPIVLDIIAGSDDGYITLARLNDARYALG